MTDKEIARQLVNLVRLLARQPGNRLVILERVAELERMLER